MTFEDFEKWLDTLPQDTIKKFAFFGFKYWCILLGKVLGGLDGKK